MEFEGGKGNDFSLTLGSGQFIPGFEDQLIGTKAGETANVNVKFPEGYQAAELAGKDALFVVTVKEVKAPEETKIDDELAKKLGLDDLTTLKERVRDQLKNDYSQASRLHLKRRILDALDAEHTFALPPTMVEGEFDAIWRAVQAELEREGKKPEDEASSEEELKKEYHDIAERRVRLGLVLARLGEQNGITIAPDEINRAIAMRARQFPGQEQQVFQFYQTNIRDSFVGSGDLYALALGINARVVPSVVLKASFAASFFADALPNTPATDRIYFATSQAAWAF